MDNFRASLFMISSMAFFACEDAFVIIASKYISGGQILFLIGLCGGFIFWFWQLSKGRPLWTKHVLHPMVLLRNFGELFGTVGFVLAILLTPLSSASAIIQAIPLVVMMMAAVFLQEQVGWRRWSAVLVGLFGVMLVVKPGLDGFEPASLFAVQAVIGLSIRDICTRRLPEGVSSQQVSSWAFFVIALSGLMIMFLQNTRWEPLTLTSGLLTIGALSAGLGGYMSLVLATRSSDISVVAPFRYSRLVFGMILGIVIFHERPDLLTYVGSAIIVVAGVYAFVREHRAKRASLKAARAL